MIKALSYRSLIIGIVLLFSVVVPRKASSQQKMQFSQYMFNGIVINPAYAGVDGALSLTAVQREQWTGIKNAPSTQTLSAHSLFKKKKLGVGLTLVNDKVGVHRNQSILTQYAFHLPLTEHATLSFGLQGGIFHLRSDYASLKSADSDFLINDPVLSKTFFDAGTGFYFRNRRFHAGISVPEIISKDFAFNDTLTIQLSRVNLFLFSKYSIPVSEFVVVEPGFLLKQLKGVPLSFDLNMNMIYREVLVTGVSYRKSESIDFLLKMQVSRQLQLGYSYDHPIGVLSHVARGSHELCVNFVFKEFRKKVISPRR